MAEIKCPDCGSKDFYVKDPDDQYQITEFSLTDGEIVSTNENVQSASLQIGEETEVFCDRCAWHDVFRNLGWC